MSSRLTLLGILGIALLAMLAFALGSHPAPDATRSLPTVQITLPDEPFEALFLDSTPNGNRRAIAVKFRDVDGLDRSAKASLRGFSAWHHGRTKPSLRVKQKDPESGAESFVELSRPEDPLAICNWLPDQLALGLGLLHEHSEPVRLLLGGRDFGVYLRSLRPGDQLCVAASRPRGTFFKGDSLGARRHLDLWAGSPSWRAVGADDPRAIRALDDLLASLREPASPTSWQDLAGVLDLEFTARMSAVAALAGSIHADAVHNHVLFYDPSRHRLEPLLWDANGFGIHAEPDLAVDVVRHPLAARLLCQPEFVHRRNQVLWSLLHGPGSAATLLATVDRRLDRLDPVLRRDPEIARLRLRRGVFEADPLEYHELSTARDEFATFVERRQAMLLAWFAHAAVAIEPLPDNQQQTRVTVYGNVAVAVQRLDGAEVRAVDGRTAALLLPGLTERLTDLPQHRQADGRGVSAPFASPAALRYVLDCPPQSLSFRNAFTHAVVQPRAAPAAIAQAPSRSIHPWQFGAAPRGTITLGPGKVRIATTLEVPSAATLRIAPGTELELAADIRCFGRLEAVGTAAAPIEVRCDGAGIRCIGHAVRLQHLQIIDTAPWRGVDGGDEALLALGGCDTEIRHCRLLRASGIALEIIGGRVTIRDTEIARGHGTAIVASADAEVRAENLAIQYARRAIVARDGATVHWRSGTLRGHRIGVRAERSAPGFAGATAILEDVTCRDTGLFDVDCDSASAVQLINTRASTNPLARGRITRSPLAPDVPASPR